MEEKQVVVSTNPPTSSSTVETSPSTETVTQNVDTILADINVKPGETTPTEESISADREIANTLPASVPSQPKDGKFISGGVETDLETLEKRCKRFGIPFNPLKSIPGPSSSPVSTSSQPTKETFISGGVETDLETLEKRCKRFGIPFDPSKYVQTKASKQVKRARNEVNAGVSIALTCLIL